MEIGAEAMIVGEDQGLWFSPSQSKYRIKLEQPTH